MSDKVMLEVTFICGDHIALLRSLMKAGLVASSQPKEVAVHGAKQAVPADWIAVEFGDRSLSAEWADDSYVHVTARDLVSISTREFELDAMDLASRLAKVEFEAANVAKIRWWDNPKGPAYKAPSGTIGTSKLGFAVAFRGVGHGRAMSRRWLESGPWRVLREDNDTTFLQFHDQAADVATSVAQAKPGHAQMSASDQGPLPLRRAYDPAAIPLKGTYVGPERRLVMAVAGRTVPRKEMRAAAGVRFYQLLGAEQPVDNVVYTFMDKAELDGALPDLWLYGLEAKLRVGDGPSGLERMDDEYAPPPYDKPAWVKSLGRDDKVN